MTAHRLRLAAALLGVGVATVAVSAAWPWLGATDRELAVAEHADARAAPEILVLSIDEEFLRNADATPLLWEKIPRALRLNPPRAAVMMPDTLEAASQRLTRFDLASLNQAAQAEIDTIADALTFLIEPLDRFLLAYDAPVSDPDGDVLTVQPRYPDPRLADTAHATGMAPQAMSSDRSTRQLVPLAARAEVSAAADRLLPSVVLTIALSAADSEAPDIRFDGDRAEVDNVSIPTEDDIGLRPNYARALLPGGAQVVTATDLTLTSSGRESIPPRFEDRIVLVGVAGESARRLPAPVGEGHLAPVFVAANALNTVLTEQYLTPASRSSNVAVSLTAMALATLLWVFAPWWLAGPLSGAAILGWRAFVDAQVEGGTIHTLLGPIVAIVVISLIAAAVMWVRVLRHRRTVSSLFARYVPERVAEQLLEGDLAQELSAGRRFEVSVLFVDLRGFTPVANSLDPTDVRRLLDCFYSYVSEAVLDDGGTVVQFVGDEVFAVFGAPLSMEDHRGAALRTAVRLQEDHHHLDQRLADESLPQVGFGIGVHAGPVIAAHVGTSARSQYAVIGDTVNVGSRLCGLAGRAQVVTTIAGADGFTSLGPRRLKGVPGETELYIYAHDGAHADTRDKEMSHDA